MREVNRQTRQPVSKTFPAMSVTRAQEQRQAQQVQAEREARKPEAIKTLDRQLHRLKFLAIAVKFMNGQPGSLRREYDKLAASTGLTLRRQKGVLYWTRPPKTLNGSNNFENHFGMAGEPMRCKETCGLSGHLFDDDTRHDAAAVREYIELWQADLEARRQRENQQYAVRSTSDGGAVSTIYPSW